jgi:ferritin
MIKAKVESAINEQIKNEFYSAYVYLAMSAYCDSLSLPGFANWLRYQYQEEMAHGMRLFDFLLHREGRVKLLAIDKPKQDFGSTVELFEEVLAHEQMVTGMINDLYEIALGENDYPTQVEVQWFITEQVEEEKNAANILEQLKMVGDNKSALLMLDRELAGRTGAEE